MSTVKFLLSRLREAFEPLSAPAAGLPSAEEAYRLLAENCLDVVFRFGADGKAKYISPSAERLYGCSRKELMQMGGSAGENPFLHPDDQPMVAKAIARHFSGEVEEMRLQFRILRADRTPVWVETNGRTVMDPASGRPTDLVLTMRDISERKALEDQLASMARSDALTGLANRRRFDEALDAEWRRASRIGSELSLLLVDIDYFKQFNDHHGHQVGDDCLRSVAAAMRDAVKRSSDLVARYGGEEFAVILPHTGQAAAVQIARTLRENIAGLAIPHPCSTAGETVTVSIGVATAISSLGASLKMPDGLVEAADRALYAAKRNGRNRVESTLLLTPRGAVSQLAG